MATLRQKKLAKAIVDNLNADKPLNKTELVVLSGYDPVNADAHASAYIQQKGTQKELNNYGFNNETADGVVLEILTAGENDMVKLNAADKLYKRTGAYAPVKQVVAHIELDVPPEIQDLANDLLTHQRTTETSN